jgi:hypothetical protein
LFGNGTTNITENGNLTWNGTTNILNVTGTKISTAISTTNLGIGVTNPSTSSLEIIKTSSGVNDIITMKRDEVNNLRITQVFVAVNQIKQIFFQLNGNVDSPVMTFYGGNLDIGTTDPGLYKLDVGGTSRTSVLRAPTIGIGITNPTLTSLYILNTQTSEKDVIVMNYDGNNGLKIRQSNIAANDIKYTFYQTNNNVISDSMTIYKGSIGIGTTTPLAGMELDVVGITRSTALTVNNIGIGITNPTESLFDIVSPIITPSDLINMRYNDSNGLKITQDYVVVNDFKQSFVQRNNGGNVRVLTFYKNNVGIGTTVPAATDKLSVTGNTKITGTTTIDTNLVVDGSAGIVGTSQFTGNMGVGTAASIDANVRLNILGNTVASGDINILGNNRYRIGGIAVGSWLTSANLTDIFYNVANVGIGTTNPTTKLHITENTTNTTTLTIQNNISSLIVSTPTPTIKINGNYTQLEFYYTTDTTGAGQTVYNYTIPSGVVCDILMVGGGAGGGRFGGGGGTGGILYATNVSLTAGQIKVGKGGLGTVNGNYTTGGNGANTSLYVPAFPYTFIASGGGGGGSRQANTTGQNGVSGGCGGGGSQSNDGTNGYPGTSTEPGFAPGFYIYFLSYGNGGGYGRSGTTGTEPTYASGGGGGTGGNGISSSTTTGGGNGGAGRDYSVQFGTSVGHNGWFAGGGGGNTYQGAGNRGYSNGGNGLFGGGGSGGYDGAPTEYSGEDALPNTGGGGGGSKWDGTGSLNGGNGGSGIVIIRYLTPTSISSINLIRGDTTDGNIDYKIENYNGNYFIKKASNSIDTPIFEYYRSIDAFNLPITGGVSVAGPISGLGVSSSGNMEATGTMYSAGNITAGSNIYLSGWLSKLGSASAL